MCATQRLNTLTNLLTPRFPMIKYLDLKRITDSYSGAIHEAVNSVVSSGWYLQGESNRMFEQEYASYIGTKHCIGCANGLDALTLIIQAYIELGRLKPGDEVLVPANTYIASVLAITANGLTPVLVEPDITTFQIDGKKLAEALTPSTRALLIVHLYGRCAYTKDVREFCEENNLLLVEDNAQAHGCVYEEGGARKRTGSLGHAAGHSFYPGKNLGALGDGGAITTDDDNLALLVRTLANYGSNQKYIFTHQGRNSRLDEVQAAVLRVKLRRLDQDNKKRRDIAMHYLRNISNPSLLLPSEDHCKNSVHHIFPVMCKERDRLQKHLAENGIQTLIHYPVPPHKQECYKDMSALSLPVTEQIHREELSIPLYPELTWDEVNEIVKTLNRFS